MVVFLRESTIGAIKTKMVNFISVVFFVCCFLGASASEFCKLDTKSCSCIADNGWGIDLRNISGKAINSSASGDSIYLSLCQDSHEVPAYVNGPNNCADGYSICQVGEQKTINGTKYVANYLVRDQSWPPMTKASDESALVFNLIFFTLRLICVREAFDTNLVVKANDTDYRLYAPSACLALLRPAVVVEGLGTGAILSIIILVTLFSYCTLGIVYNHFVRGTRGTELIPNVDFWRQLPGLVMDGVRFIQNGCKHPSTDDLRSPTSGRETYDSI